MNARLPSVAIAVLIGCASTAPAQDSPRDYPQWRGRNRDGSASAFSEPSPWPDNLRRRWKVEAGEGYATPIVIGNTVYAFTRRDGREVMTAFDATTGAERWRSGYAAPYTPSPPTVKHGSGPKATPLFHSGRLYALGISGIFSAFDAATGRILWQTAAPAEHPYFSAASSPVGDGTLIFAHPGNYGPLTAFDALTGQVKWTAKGDGLYSSPIVVDLGGTRQVVSVLQDGIIGVSITDGAVLWRYPWAGANGSTSPTLHDSTIIVSGSSDQGVVAIRPVRRNQEWIVEPVWQTRDVSLFMSNPVVIGGTLFGLSHKASGQFFALDATTGKVLWLGEPREAANTAVVKAGTVLFLLNDDGELVVAQGSRDRFEALKRYPVADSATWAQPAISGNRIFIKDVSSLTLWTID